MIPANESCNIPTERDFMMDHVRTAALFLAISMTLSTAGVFLTSYYLEPRLFYLAMLKAVLFPVFIVPVCFWLHTRTSLSQHRTMVELINLATTDEMTGLPNRRAFMSGALEKMQNTDLERAGLGVLLIDLDHFKSINDTYGHQIGDEALMHAATLIRRKVKEGAVIARLGGEEFAVMFPFATIGEFEDQAERIRSSIANTPLRTQNRLIQVTASLGMSAVVQGDTVSSALCRADNALYEAKAGGRNRFSIAA